GRGRLVFVNLQKRLLSSVSAFHQTLQLHADAVQEGRARAQLDLSASSEPLSSPADDEDEYGADDATQEARDAHEALASSRILESPRGRARTLLDEMVRLGRQHRAEPDAKVLALLDWIRRHQCPGARIGGLPHGAAKSDRTWSDTRVIVFTEYGDTKRWLREILDNALDGSDRASERIHEFHGGMSDDQRAAVQEAFNGSPTEHPVRILLATDAAREGVNLQGHCADLFHYDVPWNPARIEQRNGRIDRTLQESPVVRCHYFVYPARTEDAVLDTIVEKVGVIRRELGSLGSVVMERFDQVLARGIDKKTGAELDEAVDAGKMREADCVELEVERTDLKKLAREIDDAASILASSAKVLDFDPPLLRDAIDVGLELSGISSRLAKQGDEGDAWKLPAMPDSWQQTLDAIRSPRAPDEAFWEWRKRPLPAVTFTAPKHISDRRVHLHLSHPIVQRVMSHFLAQGFSAHDLSRVTVVRSRHDYVTRAIAFGRLSLFGPGATRLHDQLVMVAAQVLEAEGEGHLQPGSSADDKKALERLEQLLAESATLDHVGTETQRHLRIRAAGDFKKLWQHIKLEADAVSHDAEAKLRARGKAESASLRRILETQRDGIDRRLTERRQGVLPFTGDDRDSREARKQWDDETTYLDGRRTSIVKDIETEPGAIEALYDVRLRRLEPVGLVYIWPETKG
ncbi:MAG: SWF/SNF helicase family protein, partial [Sandaracinaceae bacterium]|nr:SWF/SNF helicase family protein [Sandaracinaceae bacterium]